MFTETKLLTKNTNKMETNSEEKKLSEIEVNEKFESISRCSINKIAYSMDQLFSAHDIIVGEMKNIDKNFVKRAILSEKEVLSSEMLYVFDKLETFDFTSNQKEFLRGIIEQERAMINLLDDEYKKIV